MNSIATPRKTEADNLVSDLVHRYLAVAIASLSLTMVLISFRPFPPESTSTVTSAGGDVFNQLGFGSLGVLSIMSIFFFPSRKIAAALISPAWVVLLAFVALSVAVSPDPSVTMRAALFMLIGLVIVCAVLVLPRNIDDFCIVLLLAASAVSCMSYAGLALFPSLAKHTNGDQAGLWRGVYSHKNLAGPVMAALSFAGFYLFRRGRKLAGIVIFVASINFMLHTGSKTTVGLVPLTVLMVVLPNLFGVRFLTPILVAAALIATGLGTIGTVFIEPLGEFAQAHYGDPTFTGRTTIWQFGGEMLMQHPWTGFGLDGFWGTMNVLNQPLPLGADWDMRNIVHGHNGYLDVALTMGLPALGALIVTCLILPLNDYIRVPLLRENVFLADFFMMILIFTSLNAFLESFFFRRVDPVWFFFAFSVLGLRLVARFPVRAYSD